MSNTAITALAGYAIMWAAITAYSFHDPDAARLKFWQRMVIGAAWPIIIYFLVMEMVDHVRALRK